MLAAIVTLFYPERKTALTIDATPANLWALVDPVDADPSSVNWYYGEDETGFRQMYFTYSFVDAGSLPNFVSYDNPAELAYVRSCAQLSEDAPDRLSDDPATPAPPVFDSCPF